MAKFLNLLDFLTLRQLFFWDFARTSQNTTFFVKSWVQKIFLTQLLSDPTFF